MKFRLIYLALLCAAAAWAQGPQSGHVDVFLPALPAGSSDAVTFAVLDGSTAAQMAFLQALAAAPNKATFICQNLATQSFAKLGVHGFTRQSLGIDHRGSAWPYVATVVGCGAFTLHERWSYGGNYFQDRDDRYRAGFWGTIEIQPNLRTQGSIGGLGFVDYCPHAGLLSPVTCETSARLQPPPSPQFFAHVFISIWYGLPNDVLGGQHVSWGSNGIRFAFVPDSDRSAAAHALRSSSSFNHRNVCDEIDDATADPAITVATARNIAHGEFQERASITMTVPHVTPPSLGGELFACSGPLHLRWTTTTYDSGLSFTHSHTNDSYEIWWYGRRLSLRPNGYASAQFSGR